MRRELFSSYDIHVHVYIKIPLVIKENLSLNTVSDIIYSQTHETFFSDFFSQITEKFFKI